MRDSRFKYPGVSTYEADLDAKAKALRDTVAEQTALNTVLQRWWGSELNEEHADQSSIQKAADRLLRLCASLRPELKALGGHASAALLGPADTAEARAGAFLLGDSAAIVIQQAANGAAYLDEAVSVLRFDWRSINAFLDALAAHNSQWPPDVDLDQPSVTPATLAGLVADDFPPRLPPVQLLEADAAARAQGVVVYVWERRDDLVALNVQVAARCRLLARRDWNRLASLAESLPLRELRKNLWRALELDEDRDAILSLLSASPPVFASGVWTGRVVGLEALDLASRHADSLYFHVKQNGGSSSELEQVEILKWFGQVVEGAVARPDGRLLLLMYAAHLMQEVLQPPVANRSWSSTAIAIKSIRDGMGASPGADEMQLVARLGVGPLAKGNDAATYLIAGAILGGDPRSLWGWYRSLLESSDENLSSHARTWVVGPSYQSIASRLATLANPVEEWRAAWDALFVSDRERARFEPTSQTALLPSTHLVRVGTALLRESPALSNAGAFFREIRAKVRLLIANEHSLLSHLPRCFSAEGLDLIPVLFSGDWNSILVSERGLLIGQPDRQVFAASTLLNAGISIGELEAQFQRQGYDLADALTALQTQRERDPYLQTHWDRVMNARERGT